MLPLLKPRLSPTPHTHSSNLPGEMSMLLEAVHRVNVPRAAALLLRGADVNTTDNQGVTPLIIACERGERSFSAVTAGQAGEDYCRVVVRRVSSTNRKRRQGSSRTHCSRRSLPTMVSCSGASHAIGTTCTTTLFGTGNCRDGTRPTPNRPNSGRKLPACRGAGCETTILYPTLAAAVRSSVLLSSCSTPL